MKSLLSIILPTLILVSGCATSQRSREIDSYAKVKTCGGSDLKIDFFVFEPSDKPDEDIFTKKLIIKIEIFKSGYGALTMWLRYKAIDPPEKRNLPEDPPEKITIQTNSAIKNVSKNYFSSIWREFMSPINLTFIENCLFN